MDYDLLAKGFNQVEIAKACVTSEPTISRDVECLRREATALIEGYVDDLSFQNSKAGRAVDIVLRFAFEILDDKAREDRLEAAKLILQASEIRLDFLAHVTALDKAGKYVDNLKKEVD